MKNLLQAITFFLLINAVCLSQTKELNVMPIPRHVDINDGQFILDSAFTIKVSPSIDRLFNSSTRFLRRLSNVTGIFFKQDYITAQNNLATASLQ